MVLYIIALVMVCFTNLNSTAETPDSWFGSLTILVRKICALFMRHPEFYGIETDKIIHFILFLPYSFLVYYAFHTRRGKFLGFVLFLILATIIGAMLGGVIELVQQQLGYRSCDILDFKADCYGILVSDVIIILIGAITKKW